MPKWPWSRDESTPTQQNIAAVGQDIGDLVQAEDYSSAGADVWGRMTQERSSRLLSPAAFGFLNFTVRESRQKGDTDFSVSLEHVASFLEWARDKGIAMAVVLEKQRRDEFAKAGAAFLGCAALDTPGVLRQYQSILLTPHGMLGIKRIAPMFAQQDDLADPVLVLRRQDRNLRLRLLDDAVTNGIDAAEQRYISALADATNEHFKRMR